MTEDAPTDFSGIKYWIPKKWLMEEARWPSLAAYQGETSLARLNHAHVLIQVYQHQTATKEPVYFPQYRGF